MNQNIEIKIKKLKVNYLATADLFPACKGIGKTKKLALKKLASSISSFISKMVEENLSDVFQSENYTQILFDQTKTNPEEVIGYNLYSKSKKDTSLLFKFSEFSELGSDDNNELETINDNNQHILDAFNIIDEGPSDRDIYEQPILHQQSNQDNILFGFPINFN